jgi:hypothetical protein
MDGRQTGESSTTAHHVKSVQYLTHILRKQTTVDTWYSTSTEYLSMIYFLYFMRTPPNIHYVDTMQHGRHLYYRRSQPSNNSNQPTIHSIQSYPLRYVTLHTAL